MAVLRAPAVNGQYHRPEGHALHARYQPLAPIKALWGPSQILQTTRAELPASPDPSNRPQTTPHAAHSPWRGTSQLLCQHQALISYDQSALGHMGHPCHAVHARLLLLRPPIEQWAFAAAHSPSGCCTRATAHSPQTANQHLWVSAPVLMWTELSA